MSTREQAVAAPYPMGADPPRAARSEEPCPRIGPRVDLRTTAPGVVRLEPLPDHRLRIHAGPPVRGPCRDHRFRYTRGDIDIVPAGLSDVWEEEGASTSLIVRLAPSLLQCAAEEMGIDADRAGLEPRHQIRDAQIEHIAWALDAERRAGHPSGLLYRESLGMALAVHLLGRYPAPRGSREGLSKPRLRRVTEYIEAHLDQDLSLASPR